jgi:hypothetical protein
LFLEIVDRRGAKMNPHVQSGCKIPPPPPPPQVLILKVSLGELHAVPN